MANKKILSDDKGYWKDRHAQTDNLKASGIKSVGVKSNQLVYKILEDQYQKLLGQLDLSHTKSVIDCGFGDGYFLNFFEQNFPQLDIYGVDISEHAKQKVNFKQKNRLFIGDLTDLKIKQKFDIVHCFDVLYHVLDDTDYEQALSGMAKLSKKYVILHERFLDKSPIIASKHVRLRNESYTTQILNSQGFFLYKEMPTHFVAMRMFTYKLNKIMPGILYNIDKAIADRLHPSTQEAIASHKIRVYARS